MRKNHSMVSIVTGDHLTFYHLELSTSVAGGFLVQGLQCLAQKEALSSWPMTIEIASWLQLLVDNWVTWVG